MTTHMFCYYRYLKVDLCILNSQLFSARAVYSPLLLDVVKCYFEQFDCKNYKYYFHLFPGLAAASTAHLPFPSGPRALEIHKGALTREKKEPVPLGRDYILVRFFSPLGQPPLNPPLPWLESEQGKAGWTEKKGTHMSNEVLHCCIE